MAIIIVVNRLNNRKKIEKLEYIGRSIQSLDIVTNAKKVTAPLQALKTLQKHQKPSKSRCLFVRTAPAFARQTSV